MSEGTAEINVGEGSQVVEQNWADTGPLGSLTIGLLIIAQTMILFGQGDPLTIVAMVPWILVAFPVLLIVVIIQFRRGDLMGGTANGLLGAVIFGQNLVKGLFDLVFFISGKVPPPGLVAGGLIVDALAFATGGLVLLVAGVLAGFGSKWAALSVWAAGLGFISYSVAMLGFGPIFGLFGGIGMMIVAAWLIYSGIAGLVNGTFCAPVLPLGKPLFGSPQ
jgi:hypothetical protein